MNKTMFVIALWVANAVQAFGDSPAQHGPLSDHLIGKWVLQGTIGGKETTHDIDADWVLNDGYVRLHEVSREKDSNGRPAYEAIMFISWDERSREYSFLILDSTSNVGLTNGVIGHAKPDADKIPFLLKYKTNETFHTTFLYDKNTDSWQWVMDDETDGKMRPFARVTLTRKTRDN